MMKRFSQAFTIELKSFKSAFPIISLLVFAFGVMSFSPGVNFASVNKYPIKDSSGVDSIGKVTLTSPVADSSKLFASLLPSSNSQGKSFNFSVNPEAKFFVDDYIRKHTGYFNNMKIWGKPYFDLYDRILSSYGIPVQLKYLSVIESSLKSGTVSWAGAVGPWQIMTDAAREHGLRTGYYDDRLDYIKSTNAAAQILKELYSTYGDWLLVIAAYNCGSGSVNRAIAKGHSKNFWNIQYYLPGETRNHVKKFIATHYYFEGDGSVATMTANEAQNNFFTDAVNKSDPYAAMVASCATINIYGKYNSVVIANTLLMDITLFNELNPDIDNVLAKGDIYPLRIPSDKVEMFQSKKIEILKQSVELLLNSATPSGGAGK
jgi:membrane-bound lytic murein transglycosylase D